MELEPVFQFLSKIIFYQNYLFVKLCKDGIYIHICIFVIWIYLEYSNIYIYIYIYIYMYIKYTLHYIYVNINTYITILEYSKYIHMAKIIRARNTQTVCNIKAKP